MGGTPAVAHRQRQTGGGNTGGGTRTCARGAPMPRVTDLPTHGRDVVLDGGGREWRQPLVVDSHTLILKE